jgi:hypothetical protein
LRREGGRSLTGDKKDTFWRDVRKSDKKLPDKKGVYVFAIRTDAGHTPIYVGKTKKSFLKECFNSTNWGKYYEGLTHYAEGTPVMLFVVLSQPKGAPNGKAIGEVETFLTQLASLKNPRLVNSHNKVRKWSIQGLNGHRRTEGSEATRSLRDCLGLAQCDSETAQVAA